MRNNAVALEPINLQAIVSLLLTELRLIVFHARRCSSLGLSFSARAVDLELLLLAATRTKGGTRGP
jgi:hypothetical protein